MSTFQEDSKTDKNGPVPFKKLKVQGDGSTIEVRYNTRHNGRAESREFWAMLKGFV